MSRYCGEKIVGPILSAAKQWKEKCLLQNGSVFSKKSLWESQYLESLEAHFINKPDEGEGDFFEKLESQLESTPPEVKQLAAEMFWVMSLCPSNVGKSKKLESISKIWLWGGESLDENHPLLSGEVLSGIGSSGTSYNTNRWRELVFFIRTLISFKALSGAQKERLMKDGWQFSEWLESIPESDSRQLRHMFLFLLFPDDFERIFGGTDRRSIVIEFTKKLRREVRKLSALEIDKILNDIRKEQIEQYSTDELDFYVPPLRDLWKTRKSKSFLFTWNPKNWEWDGFNTDRESTADGKSIILRWSCSNKGVAIGDKAYLLRTGINPRGIIAAGNVVREPFEALHWNVEKANEGKTKTYVEIEFTQILDPVVDSYISTDDLSKINIDGQDWFPQDSGIEIITKSAGVLEKLWQQILSQNTNEPINLKTEIKEPKNIILYGPPGTGKTYYLNKLVTEYTDISDHMSADEWIESVISKLTWWEIIAAALFDIKNKTKVANILMHPYILAKARIQGRGKGVGPTLWSNLQHHALVDSETVKTTDRGAPYIFNKTNDSYWYLLDTWDDDCPEVIGAVEKIKQGPSNRQEGLKRYIFVTFHQAYSYEDFVEGIRPQETEEDSGDIIYKVQPGVFRRICQKAKNDPDHRYAIFIDEINRGNIAKILGELITLIEPDKRAIYDSDDILVEGMELTLPYSGDKFGVPKNLDIIATMNTADRSIALLDTALRRRFQFEEMMPNAAVISGARGDGYIPDGDGGLIDLRALLDAVNKRMRFLLHRDQTLGHAYFTVVKDFSGLKNVLLHQVIPLLQEYFYEDWHRIQLVFKDVGPSGEKIEPQLICHESVSEIDVLGFDHDDYEDSIEYWVVPKNEISPETIRKIYENG